MDTLENFKLFAFPSISLTLPYIVVCLSYELKNRDHKLTTTNTDRRAPSITVWPSGGDRIIYFVVVLCPNTIPCTTWYTCCHSTTCSWHILEVICLTACTIVKILSNDSETYTDERVRQRETKREREKERKQVNVSFLVISKKSFKRLLHIMHSNNTQKTITLNSVRLPPLAT